MDKASAYGAGDCRLESCQGHCCRPAKDHPELLLTFTRLFKLVVKKMSAVDHIVSLPDKLGEAFPKRTATLWEFDCWAASGPLLPP